MSSSDLEDICRVLTPSQQRSLEQIKRERYERNWKARQDMKKYGKDLTIMFFWPLVSLSIWNLLFYYTVNPIIESNSIIYLTCMIGVGINGILGFIFILCLMTWMDIEG